MEPTESDLLTEVEKLVKKRFDVEQASKARMPSSARAPQSSDRVTALVLPDNERGRMPLTKDKYLVRENPHLVAWEREVRKFLRNLPVKYGHRVSAVMIYEWATGINVAELMAEGGTASPELRKINQILKFYFGNSYMTYIAGRKVPRAYKVPVGWYVNRHRPMTLTLWVEYQQGTKP